MVVFMGFMGMINRILMGVFAVVSLDGLFASQSHAIYMFVAMKSQIQGKTNL